MHEFIDGFQLHDNGSQIGIHKTAVILHGLATAESTIISSPISLIMGDHDSSATCLSSETQHLLEGPKEVRDVLLHYFGCLRQDKREAFYDSLDAHQQLWIRDELRRIRELRALFEARNDGLVRLLTTSLSNLRQSAPYRKLKRRGPAVDPIESRLEAPAPNPAHRCGLNANMILFWDSKKYTDEDYPDEFPNQKLPIDELLYNKDKGKNPLMKPCPKKMIRYFHLPANNMSWAEVGWVIRAILNNYY
jgi:hypothetical protein